MRIGLQIPDLTFPGGGPELGADLKRIGRTAEEAGFYSVWMMDHFFQIPIIAEAEHEMLEGYSTLTYLAALTERVKLGTMVTGVTYRHPGLLVKIVTALDVLSGGRAYLGIGAAWFDREHHGLGVPFPPLSERFERLEETLQIAKQMWSGEVSPYEGRHYRLAETLNEPGALTRPHPPILIGGGGERKTLRLVAQYGDACNLFYFFGVAALRHKLDVLKRHCDELGRDYDSIEKTCLNAIRLGGDGASPADVIRTCQELAEMGFSHVIYSLGDVHQLKPLEVFGREIIPELAGPL